MNRIFLLSVVLSLIIYGCSSGNNRNKKEVTEADKALQEQADSNLIVYPSDSGTVHLDLTDGRGELIIHKNKDQSIYLIFNSDGYKKLSATLSSPDSLANIRFSQIILPDGKMDGPFGRDMNYDLPINGTYRIRIHENMMAGDPWEGNFAVKVQLTK